MFREEQLPNIIKALIRGNTARGITSIDEVESLLKTLPPYTRLTVDEKAWIIQEAEKELAAVAKADREQPPTAIKNIPSREETGQAIEYGHAGKVSVDVESLRVHLEKAEQNLEAATQELEYMKQLLYQ